MDEAATRIREEVDKDANIIVGATFDESLEGIIRVSVVATGIDKVAAVQKPAETKRPAMASMPRVGAARPWQHRVPAHPSTAQHAAIDAAANRSGRSRDRPRLQSPLGH